MAPLPCVVINSCYAVDVHCPHMYFGTDADT